MCQVLNISSPLTPQIITGDGNEVSIGWDKLNKITTTIHGSNVVSSTTGGVIKGVKDTLLQIPTGRFQFMSGNIFAPSRGIHQTHWI